MYKLVIENEEGHATEIPLVRDEISIGRKEGNTVRLPERNVSRRHARIFKDNGHVYLEDAGSRYGIKVNGARIDEQVRLEAGDHIQIGDYQIALQHEGDEVGPVAPQPVPRADGSSDPEPDTEVLDAVALEANRQASSSAAPSSEPAEAQLVVLSSNLTKGTYPLTARETLIGREGEVDILLEHASMSRTHAKIVHNGRVWSIVDQSSANGVKVNGEEVGAKDLRNGDTIGLGEVKLRFVRRREQGALEGKVADYHVRQAAEQRKRLLIGLVVGIGLIGLAMVTLWDGGTPPKPAAEIPPAAPAAAAVVVDPVEEALKQARGFIAQRKWSDALAHLDDGLRRDPANTDAQALRNRARAEALNMQTFEELQAAISAKDLGAIDTKLQAIGEDSVYRLDAVDAASNLAEERAAHHLALGDTAQEAEDSETALAEYEATLRTDPNNVEAKRGRMLIRMSLKSKAARAADEAAAQPGGDEAAAAPQGGGEAAGDGGLEAAVDPAAAPVEGAAAAVAPPDEAPAADPAKTSDRSPAAAVAAGKDIGASSAKVEAPVNPKPKKVDRKRDAMLMYAKARTLLRSNPKQGAALLRRSLKLDPSLAKPHRLLGNYYAEQGKPKKACKHLKKFLKLSPQHPEGPAIRAQLTRFGCGAK